MGPYLAKPVTRKVREDLFGPSGLRCSTASMQGWRVAMEDAHLALPDFDPVRGLSLFGVFDGHCGGVVARLAARLLPRKLAAARALRDGDYPAALHEAFLAFDKHLDSPFGRKTVLEEAAKVRTEFAEALVGGPCEVDGAHLMEALEELCACSPDDMGCTAVVALLEHTGSRLVAAPRRLHVANCGDSRCVLWDDRGRAVAMSYDHKPRAKRELARIRAAGSWVTGEGRIEGNLNLSRALGDFAYKRTRREAAPEKQIISGVPEVRTRTLRPRDRFVLLACDGIWEARRGSQSTVDMLRRRLPPRGSNGKLSVALAQFLQDHLAPADDRTGVGLDNMTALLVQLPELRGHVAKRPAAARA